MKFILILFHLEALEQLNKFAYLRVRFKYQITSRLNNRIRLIRLRCNSSHFRQPWQGSYLSRAFQFVLFAVI